jgi:hypothetical protein
MKLALHEMIDMTVNYNKGSEWRQTKWLVLSSTSFFIPSIYGYFVEEYLMSYTLFFTALISMNYWRHANYSWRRIVDKIFAKISFIVFFINGVRYVSGNICLINGYTFFILIIYCYYMSNKLGATTNNKLPNNELWWKYHMAFHAFMSYNQTLIIYCAAHHNKIKKENILH